MEKEKFGKNLIRLRKQKGYTQQELADIVKVTNKAVSRWETAEGYPDITMLIPLSEALGVSCDELLRCEKSYRDISKEDMQRYLPYGLAVLGLLVFYILSALQVPLPVSMGIMALIFAGGFYLMIHHTNRQRLPNFTRCIAVLSLFPILKVVEMMLFFNMLMSMLGISPMVMFTSGINQMMEAIMGDSSSFGTQIGTIYMLELPIALVLTVLLYAAIRSWLKRTYALSWPALLKGSNPKQKQRSYKISNCLTLVTTLLVFALLVYWYYTYTHLDASNYQEGYLVGDGSSINKMIHTSLSMILMPGILYQVYALVHHHTHWCYLRNLIVLVPYLGSITWLTYMDVIYVTSPLWIVGGGAILIMTMLKVEWGKNGRKQPNIEE